MAKKRAPRATRDPLSVIAVGALLVVFPLAATPAASDPVMPVRMVLLGLSLALAILGTATGGLPRTVLWSLLAGGVVFLVTSLTGATPLLSLLGRYPRYEGLPMMAAYAACLWVGARLLGPRSERLRNIGTSAVALTALVHAVVALVGLIVSPGDRVTGLLGNSTTLGVWGIVSVGLLGWRLSQDRRTLWVAGALAGAVTLVLSASRGALVGAGVAAAIATVILLRGRRKGWWIPMVAAAALVGAMLLVPTSRSRLTGTSPFSEATISGRLLLWQETWRMIRQDPLLGGGPSRFVDSINPFHTSQWAAAVGPYAPPDSPHSLILQVLASTGVVGLVAVLALAGLLLWPLLRRADLDPWQAAGLTVALGVAAAYLTAFTDPITTPLTALILGGAVATPRATYSTAWKDRALAVLSALTGLFLGGTLLIAELIYSSALGGGVGAAEILRGAAAVRPFDPDLARRVGYTIDRLAESSKADPLVAVTLLVRTCPLLPGSIECLQALADAQDLAGNHTAALETLDVALGIDPYNVDSLLKKGVALATMGKYEDAETAFLSAAAVRPTAAEPWTDLSLLYNLMGRSSDAAAAAAKAEQFTKR